MNEINEQKNPHDPERAFEDLRSEIFVLRRGIEDWQKYIEKKLPPNYSEHLSLLGKGLDEIGDRVEGVGNKIDAIQAVPREAMDAAVEEGRTMFDELKTKMSYAASFFGKERDALQILVGRAQTAQKQKERLILTGGGGVIVGLFLAFVVAYIAPFGLDGRIAAGIMGQDRWQAGQTLMQEANQDGWHQFIADANLANSNRSKVDACRIAAAKSKKDESCTITVPAP